MNENIDLTKILEGCPKGTEFYSLIHGTVSFLEILDIHTVYPIAVKSKVDKGYFTKGGRYFADQTIDDECILVPSKYQRDWSKFERFWDKPKVEKFDPNQITSLTDSMMIPLLSYGEMGRLYLSNMLHSVKDVFIALLPIALFFVVFNFFVKIKGKALGSIIVGFVYTFFGMILFFTGAESGFIPMATMLGKWFSQSSADIFPLFLVVIALFGLISMMAEPSVKILAGNVEEVSQGVISKKVIILVLGISTAISLIINALRIQYHFDYLYVIVPLFLFALLLSFVAPSIYVGIAIDSAGVATGTMASCFFLPMFIGFVASKNSASLSFGQVLMQDGFGVVGIMSVMPIITMEMMGILAEMKLKLNYQKALAQVLESDDCQVIHLPEWEG